MITSKYWLENEGGDRFSLNGDTGYLLKNVEGLGVDYSGTFHSMQNGFYTRTYADIKQGSMVGDIVYMGSAYSKYRELVDWLLGASKLTFIYQPEEQEFKRDVVLSSIEKANRHSSGWMSGEIELHCLTPWYQVEHLHSDSASIEVTALGQIESAFKMSMYCRSWSGAVGITVGDLGGFSLARTIAADTVIDYSTIPDNSYIKLNGADAMKYLDYLGNNFPKIPKGETVTISSASPAGLSFDVDLYHYWRAV